MIDYRTAFSLCLALLGVVFGITAYLVSRELSKKDAEIKDLHERCDGLGRDLGALRDRHNETLQNLPMIFARRDDVKDVVGRLEKAIDSLGDKLGDSIKRVYDKLDAKADKE